MTEATPGPMAAMPFEALLAAVGAKTPTPGGGAVASAVGALGGALASMVVAYSADKKSLAEHRPALLKAMSALGRSREVLLELAEEDAAAYGMVNQLQRLGEDDPKRREEWQAAVAAAIGVPRAVVATCCDMLRLLESLASVTNRHLRSDLAIAAILAECAARAGAWNVQVNLPLLGSPDEAQGVRAEVEGMLRDAATRRERVEAACRAQ